MSTSNNTHEIELLVPDTDIDRYSVLLACVYEITTGSKYSEVQICAFFASAVMGFFPKQKEIITDMFQDMGFVLCEIKLPSEAMLHFIRLPHSINVDDCYVLFGHLCFILFKDFTNPADYKQFMKKRISAMLGIMGCQIDNPTADKFVLDYKYARIIYQTLSDKRFFKTQLIKHIKSSMNHDSFGSLYRYVWKILSLTGMTTLCYIYDTLQLSNSPVLKDPRVDEEVIKLELALRAVESSPFPQFYRILAGPKEAYLIKGFNFPILTAVAHKLKSVYSTNAREYAVQRGAPSAIVEELVKLDNDAVTRPERNMHMRNLDLMYQHWRKTDDLFGY